MTSYAPDPRAFWLEYAEAYFMMEMLLIEFEKLVWGHLESQSDGVIDLAEVTRSDLFNDTKEFLGIVCHGSDDQFISKPERAEFIAAASELGLNTSRYFFLRQRQIEEELEANPGLLTEGELKEVATEWVQRNRSELFLSDEEEVKRRQEYYSDHPEQSYDLISAKNIAAKRVGEERWNQEGYPPTSPFFRASVTKYDPERGMVPGRIHSREGQLVLEKGKSIPTALVKNVLAELLHQTGDVDAVENTAAFFGVSLNANSSSPFAMSYEEFEEIIRKNAEQLSQEGYVRLVWHTEDGLIANMFSEEGQKRYGKMETLIIPDKWHSLSAEHIFEVPVSVDDRTFTIGDFSNMENELLDSWQGLILIAAKETSRVINPDSLGI